LASSAATWSISCGGKNGSSPCTLTTMVSSSQPRTRATAATRSVPEGNDGSVMTAIEPLDPRGSLTAAAIRSSSVATQTSAA
jgi:hypothetical protein